MKQHVCAIILDYFGADKTKQSVLSLVGQDLKTPGLTAHRQIYGAHSPTSPKQLLDSKSNFLPPVRISDSAEVLTSFSLTTGALNRHTITICC